MSSIYKPKSYRNKHQGSKFDFHYDETSINYRSEIPELPKKPKQKPDSVKLEGRIKEIEQKISKLKLTRKEKKEAYRLSKESYDQSVNQLKEKITLGRLCIAVLNNDKNGHLYRIEELGNIITRKNNQYNRTINEYRSPGKTTMPAKEISEMNAEELRNQETKIEQAISSGSYGKQEEANLHNRMKAVRKARIQLGKQQQKQQTRTQYSKQETQRRLDELKQAIATLQQDKYVHEDKLVDIESKIKIIQQDVQQFLEEIRDIVDRQSEDEQVKKLFEECTQLKTKQNELKAEIEKLRKEFETKVLDYEYEQQQIKWINWANEVQQRKQAEWQKEKQQKKKIKARGDNVAEKNAVPGAAGKTETKVQGKTVVQYERPKINRNQKDIDACSHLIDYCKGLYPKTTSLIEQNKTNKNLQEELKIGDWAKGLQVVQPKKEKKEQQPQHRGNRKRQSRISQQTIPSGFNHNFQIINIFSSLTLLPPTGVEQLDKTVEALEEKLKYFLAHPDEVVQQKGKMEKGQERQYVKYKSNNKIINNEDFPSLSG